MCITGWSLFLFPVLVARSRIPSQSLIRAPLGISLCDSRCRHIGACVGTRYFERIHLCEVMLKYGYHPKSKISIWPCGRPCDTESVCVHTRTKSSLCVSQVVRYRRRVLALKSRSISYVRSRPGQGFNKSRASMPSSNSEVPRTLSGLAIASKMEETRNGEPLEGLVTLSSVGQRSSQFNLLILTTKVWFPLHTVQGSITTVRSRGNHVYWCQLGPTICSRFKIAPEIGNYTVLDTKSTMGLKLDVDEGEDVIVVGRRQNILRVFTLKWQDKGFIVLPAHHPTGIVINSANRVLYVTIPDYDVIVFDYTGNRLFSFTLNHVSRSIDVDPAGKLFYSLDINGNLTVVSNIPFKERLIKTTPVGSRMSVIAYNDWIILAKERVLKTYDKQGKTMGKQYVMQRNKYKRRSQIVSFMSFKPQLQSGKEKKCGSPSSNSVSRQKVLIPLEKYDKFGTKTTLYSVDVADGKWRLFRHISGKVIHLGFSGPLMFHCQRSRDGLFMTNFKDGTWQNGTRILNAVCYNVAGDHEENVVFSIWSRGLFRMNLTDWSTKNTKTGIEGKITENLLSLDKQNRFIYLITLDNRIIRRVSYDGQHQSDIRSSDTLRQLIFSPPSFVFYTSRSNRHVLRKAYVPPYDKGIHPMRSKSIASGMITTFDVLSDKIAVGYRRVVTFYCRSSLVELSTIDLQKYSQNILTDMYALENF